MIVRTGETIIEISSYPLFRHVPVLNLHPDCFTFAAAKPYKCKFIGSGFVPETKLPWSASCQTTHVIAEMID